MRTMIIQKGDFLLQNARLQSTSNVLHNRPRTAPPCGSWDHGVRCGRDKRLNTVPKPIKVDVFEYGIVQVFTKLTIDFSEILMAFYHAVIFNRC